MRTSIATVCLSGGLTEKLHACAAAGFDGVEIMDADLVAADESPEEIRALCARLGLGIEMFQPFRDVEGVTDEVFADTLRRASAKFATMARLGADLVLVCSNVATATIDDDELAARQLGALADLAAEKGIRIAYEAMAWGTYVNDYRHSWRIVEKADRPNLGICLDSFHILSRGDDPTGIEQIDGDKIFFLQLADAPVLDMDLLSWSRHHRLFPGEGGFDLPGFLAHVLAAGYGGPLSLEVFNDTFRQTDPVRTAEHALRSLLWLADRTAHAHGEGDGDAGVARPPRAVDFVEIAGADLAVADEMLAQLGFRFRGRHRSKPVRLWSYGDARIVLDEQARDERPALTGIGFVVDDADAAATRAARLGARRIFRRTYAGEQDLPAVSAPDGTGVYWSAAPEDRSWVAEFEGGVGGESTDGVIDHVNLGYHWSEFDEAVLFAASALALTTESSAEVPGPRGLVRSQVMRTRDGVVRIPINLAPPTAPLPSRHIAIRCDDVSAVARRARAAGLEFLRIPANYYDDLAARFGLDDAALDELRNLGLLYDRDGSGEFVHFYTPTIGGVFLEFVERRGGYEGYGALNAPIRLAAQRNEEVRRGVAGSPA
ncbi:sugar phosphate isomerase/epimerase and 4-hydroxyphenylpyruvate domain-containing protein [Protaetiibacter mangrovi]|uniref:3-dehydroshikimate dehydratase n=1 Tax=Protaetiibacter mangrovi TaxID=2970926 RepID=A0ABT1ZHX6_9MICO|nr:sugar phosphate isomerase/epimerase and 4-hydroxyphenylpyruvate domain-containing protein [Protaetiibacter mangrovi]MCS0500323.1 sugar phosphate isomerase/epimerase and 4-hydroxyphenylpyruvate domain-containing protein [Protaetiibacter mangrovi]TPX05378.1 sugar phosphate isomerase/epimerase and 4-hydroxyphenylpyruvate domain-containing protein [Schumannella luteola]